jgi:hypothetical protein
MRSDESEIVTFERDCWRKRDWLPAAISFLSRLILLPLLRFRDRARHKSSLKRMLGNVFFYPAYLTGLVLWGVVALLLLVLSPLLFFLGRALGDGRAA